MKKMLLISFVSLSIATHAMNTGHHTNKKVNAIVLTERQAFHNLLEDIKKNENWKTPQIFMPNAHTIGQSTSKHLISYNNTLPIMRKTNGLITIRPCHNIKETHEKRTLQAILTSPRSTNKKKTTLLVSVKKQQ